MSRASNLSVLLLIMCGCSKTPESTFKSIQSDVCSGDVQAALEQIDRGAIRRNASGAVLARFPHGPAAAVDAALDSAMNEFVEELKLGDKSSLCLATDVKSSGPKSNEVTFTTPSGRSKRAIFEKHGDEFKLAGLL